MNRTFTIHAVLKARRNFFVAKVIYEPRMRGCWRPHKQKDFFLVFLTISKD